MDSSREYQESGWAKVDSANFIPYLLGYKKTDTGRLLEGRFDNFPKEIDIGPDISALALDMYNTRRVGTVLGDDARKRLQESVDIANTHLAGGGFAIPEDSAPKQVEQARMVYVEVNTGKIKATSPSYGNQTEVEFIPLLYEAVASGGYAIMGIHEHPSDGLFSIPDYFPLVFGNSHESMRLLNATMVLCPNAQILAVATTETPIFNNSEEVNNFLVSHISEADLEEKRLIEEGILAIKAAIRDRAAVELLFKTLEELDDKAGSVLDSELRQKLTNVVGSQNVALEQAEQKIALTTKEAADKAAQFNNSVKVGFANELRVKLYFSTDSRHFKEFSA